MYLQSEYVTKAKTGTIKKYEKKRKENKSNQQKTRKEQENSNKRYYLRNLLNYRKLNRSL